MKSKWKDWNRERKFKESNYYAVFKEGITWRYYLDDNNLQFKPLEYPEFNDIKITNHCPNKCPYCYQNSLEKEPHPIGITDKIKKYFGNMELEQRPFQVALGGGEPTLHPELYEISKSFYELGIIPNITSSGIFIKEGYEKEKDIVNNSIKEYIGGFAITTHRHLETYWRKAVEWLINKRDKKDYFLKEVNFHFLIYDKNSIDYFENIYNEYKDKIDYFVLLHFVDEGRGKNMKVTVEDNYDYLMDKIKQMNMNKIAFGSKFNKFINKFNLPYPSSKQELFSKYIDLVENKIYVSSFDLITEPKGKSVELFNKLFK